MCYLLKITHFKKIEPKKKIFFPVCSMAVFGNGCLIVIAQSVFGWCCLCLPDIFTSSFIYLIEFPVMPNCVKRFSADNEYHKC